MQVPTAGPRTTEIEQERMNHLRTQRALHNERIMASQAMLQLLAHEETALGDAINQRVRDEAERASAQLAALARSAEAAVEKVIEVVAGPTEIPPDPVPRETAEEAASL